MARDRFAPRRRGLVGLLLAALALVGGFGVWGALRRGPAPVVTLVFERAAVGRSMTVTAQFREPARGLGLVAIEATQGERTVVLAERRFERRGPYSLTRGAPTPEATLTAAIGKKHQEWLQEGEVLVRGRADRMAGPWRSSAPVIVEQRLPVRLRPPRLEVISQQHYVKQGGSGAIVFRTSHPAGRSGVRAGQAEFASFPLPGGGPGDRFALFAAPWNLSDPSQIRVFAEDEAGNRVEAPFVTVFKKSPPRIDRIEISDAFLEQVVPAIASQTPGFDASGSLLEQYLRINGELRRENLAQIAALAGTSEPRFLWSGPFAQLPNSARRAGFAETRDYVHRGRVVDRQTHLGLDLASLAHAPALAANGGKVVFADWLGIYGYAVILDHGYGLMSLIGHLSRVDVKRGEFVRKGQPLGATGATGLAGGDHLHLEVFAQGQSVDPVEWLDGHWIKDNLGTKIAAPGV